MVVFSITWFLWQRIQLFTSLSLTSEPELFNLLKQENFQRGPWVDHKDCLYMHSLSSLRGSEISQEEKVARKTHTTLSFFFFVSKMEAPRELTKGKRKTVRLFLPDCEWWVSQQRLKEVLCLELMSIKGQFFLTHLNSYRSDKEMKRQEEKSTGGRCGGWHW